MYDILHIVYYILHPTIHNIDCSSNHVPAARTPMGSTALIDLGSRVSEAAGELDRTGAPVLGHG